MILYSISNIIFCNLVGVIIEIINISDGIKITVSEDNKIIGAKNDLPRDQRSTCTVCIQEKSI